MDRDIREESSQELLSQQMLEFAVDTLGYKPPNGDVADFSEKFIKADTDVVYPLIYWMLDQLETLKKRAYLSQYLKVVNMPEEMFADKKIVELSQQYKTLQDQFKEVHKGAEDKRKSSLNPAELENEIEQLVQEREQLQTKLRNFKEKVENGTEYSGVNFQEILSATHNLRKEQEEESKLYQSLQEEKQKLVITEQKYRQTREKLRNLEASDMARKNPRQLLEDLKSEVEMMKQSSTNLTKELSTRVKMLNELEEVMSSSPLSQGQVNNLEREIASLSQEKDELESKVNSMTSSADGKIAILCLRVVGSEKKRENIDEQMAELREEEKDLQNDIRKLDNDLKMFGEKKPKSDEEIKAYVKELENKTIMYKDKRARMDAVKAEVEVLMNTEKILRDRDTNIQDFNNQLAKEHGVEGFQDVQDNMEKVSIQKQSLDDNKGSALESMSKVIKKIENTLRTKRDKLQPQIKDLKVVRAQHEQVESDFKEKFQVYEGIRISIEGDRSKLEQEVESNRQAIMDEEESYHYLNCLKQINQAKNLQLTQEVAYLVGDERLSPQYKSYKEMLDKLINAEDAKAKRLRQMKTSVQEGHVGNIEQRNMFLNLKTIMECKLKGLQKKKSDQTDQEPREIGVL
jgi:intraflagellar transport protein 81